MELTELQQAERLANEEHTAASRAYYAMERENKEVRAAFLEAAEKEFDNRAETMAKLAEQERQREILQASWRKRQAAVKALHRHAAEASGLIGKRVRQASGYHFGSYLQQLEGVLEVFDRDEGLYPENQKYGLPYDGTLCIRVLKANGKRSTKVVELRQNNELPGQWKFSEDVDKTQAS